MKHSIKLDVAKKMIGHYKKERERVIRDEHRGKKMLPTCETFDAEAIATLLKQPGCVKVRIYLGMDDNKEVKIILVGVNEKGEDQVPNATEKSLDTYVILEEGERCPDACPPISTLNSDDPNDL
jgi:hypothetical protein